MTSRSSRISHRSPRSERKPIKPAVSLTLLLWLAGSFCLALFALLVLFFSDIRLGQGYFAVLYSPIAEWRLERVIPVLGVGVLACGAVWALGQKQTSNRAAGYVLLALAMISAAGWAWWAPPEPMSQQTFNMSSLSTDGAFLFETLRMDSLSGYLEQFPSGTLKKSTEEMGGTRVLSNPPLTTVLAYAVKRATWNPAESPGWLEGKLVAEYDVDPSHAPITAFQLRMSVVFTLIWALSGAAAFLLGRSFLSPAGAALFAILVTFNPCTAHFVPGKDPGQLLTINLMLWAWFAGWRRKSMALAALGGAILIIGATAGLVHIWVSFIALLATLWQARRDGELRTVLLNGVAAFAGGIAVCAIAFLTLRWNIPLTLWGVSQKWTELQATFTMNRATWYAIGLPIFLLFLSPGVWALLGLTLRRWTLGFGTRLAICTVGVMLLIYGPLGVTYELPRLWIAFLPPLTLGLAIDLPLLRGREPHAKAIRAIVLIAAIQIAFTAIHWTLFDARESEYRLTTERSYY